MSIVYIEIALAVYFLTFALGLPVNFLALYAFSAKICSKPLPTDILLFNLTISDLLFLLTLPLKAYEAWSGMRWALPRILCPITTFTFFSTIYTSSLLLTAVSVVRYLGAAHPNLYRRLHDAPAYTAVTSVAIWIITTANGSVTLILHYHPTLAKNSSVMCHDNFTDGQLEVLLPVRFHTFFTLFFIPLVICVYCYLRCILILNSRSRISRIKKHRAIGMAAGTLAVFLICMLPYNLSHLVGFVQSVNPEWRHYTLLLATLNACIDPIIFYFSSPSFQRNRRQSTQETAHQHFLVLISRPNLIHNNT